MRPEVEHNDLKFLVPANFLECGRNDGAELLRRRLGLFDLAGDVGVEIADKLFEYREKKLFFVSEIIMDDTLAYAGRVGDILHGYFAVSFESDAEKGCLNYLGPSFWCNAYFG